MNQSLSRPSKSDLLIFGLISLCLSSLPAIALPLVNVCPRVYTQIVSQGCSFNLAQQALPPIGKPIVLQSNQPSQTALGRVAPYQGKISLIFRNNIQSVVTYQISGKGTQSLKSGQEVLLRNVPVPMAMTFQRSDGGLVRILPVSSGREGLLDVSLNAAHGLSDSHLSLIVENRGQVFAY